MEFVSRLIAASLWDTRKNPEIEARVEAALNTDREVRDFFEGEFTLISYELKTMLRDRANDLDWAGAEEQSELHAKALESRQAREEARKLVQAAQESTDAATSGDAQ